MNLNAASFILIGSFRSSILLIMNLKKSCISSNDTEFPSIYLYKVSGMPPNITLYFPISEIYKAWLIA